MHTELLLLTKKNSKKKVKPNQLFWDKWVFNDLVFVASK